MSSVETLEQKIDTQDGKIDELKDAILSMTASVEQMTITYTGFSARAEERHIVDKEWKAEVVRAQEKQDARFDAYVIEMQKWKDEEFKAVRDSQRANTLLLTLVAGGGGTIIGIGGTIATIYFG